MKEVRHYILATAGHVDHGKSSLVIALSGTDPDRLPEEKSRGLTIELGFAQLKLEDPNSEVEYRLGIVDVPGHEDFVRNMVGGVGSVDVALLVVAAEDGWMPQSEEHFEILNYMGIHRGIVVLTKVDSVSSEDADAREEDVRGRLADSPWENAPIVRTDAPHGEGIDILKAHLCEVLAEAPRPADVGKPRLLIDRTFSVPGAGTIVTGTLSGGSFSVGQAVRVEPGERRSRIRRLQTHNENVELSPPGTRTAINLPDLAPGKEVNRGDIVTLPGIGTASSTLDCTLCMDLRVLEMERAHVRPLKDGTRVRLHHGSAHVPATVLLLNAKELLPGEEALAQIRLEQPAIVFAGDRFILRDWQERLTMAGGIVLDPVASPSRLHATDRKTFLAACATDPGDPAVQIDAILDRDRAYKIDLLLRQSRFAPDVVRTCLSDGLEANRLVEREEWAIKQEAWSEWIRTAENEIDSFHELNPERIGLPIADLRKSLAGPNCGEELQDLVIAETCRDDFTLSGSVIHRSGRMAELPKELETSAQQIREELQANLFEPPSTSDLLTDTNARKAIQFLIDTGEAVQVGTDLVIAAEGFRQLREQVRDHISKQGPATVSELRTSLQSTRRIMVPLLEKLDSQGVTVRRGDQRALKSRG
jgi:selenocysteine-specific elongation factor